MYYFEITENQFVVLFLSVNNRINLLKNVAPKYLAIFGHNYQSSDTPKSYLTLVTADILIKINLKVWCTNVWIKNLCIESVL